MPQRVGTAYPHKAAVHAEHRPALRDGVGAVMPPLYPAGFSTPGVTSVGRGISSQYRVSNLAHKAPAGCCRSWAGSCASQPLTAPHRGTQAGYGGDCPRRSIGPAPFSPFSHRAARSSIPCKRGRFPLPHGRGQKTSSPRRDWRPPPSCHSRSIRVIRNRL